MSATLVATVATEFKIPANPIPAMVWSIDPFFVHCDRRLENLLKNVFILVQEGKERRFLKMVGIHLIES